MQYLKYGFYAVVQKPLFNILIMLEIAAILVAGNMAISVFNSRTVLYEPYAEVLEQDGYIFLPKSTPVLGTHVEVYDEEKLLGKFYDSLRGDLTILKSYSYLLSDGKNYYQSIYAYDPSLICNMKLPLKSGRWPSAEKNAEGQIEAVALEGAGYELNTLLPSQLGDIKIVGILENEFYMPITGGGIGASEDDIRIMYEVSSKTNNYIFVASTADEKLSDPGYLRRALVFIYYNTEPSDEDRNYNEQKLMEYGTNGKYFVISEVRDGTMNYLNEQYIKLMPILLCVFIIVLAELICSVAMNTNAQMRNYGIYFLCGCRWKGCLKISAAYSSVVLLGGGILGTAAFLLFQTTEYAEMFEQNIAINNLYITLILIAAMLILSLVIPFFQVRGTSPVETIKENK